VQVYNRNLSKQAFWSSKQNDSITRIESNQLHGKLTYTGTNNIPKHISVYRKIHTRISERNELFQDRMFQLVHGLATIVHPRMEWTGYSK